MQPRFICECSDTELKRAARCNNRKVRILADILLELDAVLPWLCNDPLNVLADSAVLDCLQRTVRSWCSHIKQGASQGMLQREKH